MKCDSTVRPNVKGEVTERIRPFVSGVAVLALAWPGCTTADNVSDESAVTRDSSGVRIVDHPAAAWEDVERWRLDTSIVVLDPNQDSTYEFGRVTGGAVLAGDTIVIADGQSVNLRLFDVNGEPVVSVGRLGGGPGEFRAIRSIFTIAGDTIVVWDDGNDRLTFVNRVGKVVREVPVPPEVLTRGLILLGRHGDGWAARSRNLWYFTADLLPQSIIHDSVNFVSIDGTVSTSQVIEALPNFTLDVKQRTLSGRTVRLPFPQTFSPQAHVEARDGIVVTGRSDAFAFTVYRDTKQQTRVRVNQNRRPVDAADVDALLRHREAQLQGQTAEQIDREMTALQEAGVAPSVPAYQQILIAQDGNIWIQLFATPQETVRTWAVFDPVGSLIGRVDLPAQQRVLDVAYDRVLIAIRDALDVETIVLAPLQRP